MLALMNDREWSPRELSEELDEGLSQVSYHVKVLHEYEPIELARTEPVRGATQHFYRALHRAYIPPSPVRHIPKPGRAIIVGDILGEIDKDVAASLQSGRFFSREDNHAGWTPADLDAIGCGKANELADEFVARFLEIAASQRHGERMGKATSTSRPAPRYCAAPRWWALKRPSGRSAAASYRKLEKKRSALAIRAAVIISRTEGTRTRATTSWILGAARAARSSTVRRWSRRRAPAWRRN